MNGFEGSFLGNSDRLHPAAVLECGVCWWVYDPALGDATWQVPAGTPFSELPAHWRCPNCDTPPEQFMVLHQEQPGSGHAHPDHDAGLRNLQFSRDSLLRAHAAASQRMRRLPVFNSKLDIQVVGLRRCVQGLVGIVATPWCMNIVLLPPRDAHPPLEGTSRDVDFPSGSYSFVAGQLPGVGALESCSLFSPMDEFDDPAVVRSVAEHAIAGLFTSPETQRAQDAPGMSRRSFLGGGQRRDYEQPAS